MASLGERLIGSDTTFRRRLRAESKLLATTALLAVVAGGLAASQGAGGSYILAGGVAVTLVQWVILQRVTGQSVPLPGMAIIGLNAVFVLGYLYYPSIADRAAVSATLPASREIYHAAANIFIASSLALFIGALVGTVRPASRACSTVDQARRVAALADRIPPGRLAVLAIVPLALEIIAYTPSAILARGHYSAAPGPTLAIIAGSVLAPVGMALAALLWVRPDSVKVGGLLLVCYFLVLFSMGTRQLSVLPVMMLLAWLLRPSEDTRSRWRRTAILIGAVLATIVLLQLPLTLRGSSDQSGLVPYLEMLWLRPESLLSFDIPRIMGNVLFSVPLAGTVATMGDYPHSWFVTSINPMPGSYTDWAEIKPMIRINRWTPACGLGELRNYGLAYLVGYMLVSGAILARLQAWNFRLPPARAALASVIGMGLTGGFTFDLLQYNLRSGTRMLWYFLIVSVLLHLTGPKQLGNARTDTDPE